MADAYDDYRRRRRGRDILGGIALNPVSAPESPVNGQMYYDGTNLWVYVITDATLTCPAGWNESSLSGAIGSYALVDGIWTMGSWTVLPVESGGYGVYHGDTLESNPNTLTRPAGTYSPTSYDPEAPMPTYAFTVSAEWVQITSPTARFPIRPALPLRT